MDSAIGLMRRLHRANKQRKELAVSLQRHQTELESAEAVVDIIEQEKCLRSSCIETELRRLGGVIRRLVKLIEEINAMGEKNAAKQLAHQFIHGTAQEKRMGIIMGDMCQVKTSLLLYIQTANVGIVKDLKDCVVASLQAIQRVEKLLKAELGDDMELKISQLVKDRRPSGEYLLTLMVCNAERAQTRAKWSFQSRNTKPSTTRTPSKPTVETRRSLMMRHLTTCPSSPESSV